MSFANFADLHLGGLTNILPGDSVGLQLQALERALIRCGELGIREATVAGDLFDTAQPHDTIKLRLADLLAKYGIRVWIMPGNHDRPLLDEHSLHTLDWLGSRDHLDVRVVFDPVIEKIGGIPVFLCPHPYVIDQPEGAAFSIGHYARTGARRDNGSIQGGETQPAGWWLLGDFHEPQSGPGYRYTGSLTAVEWVEAGQRKGFDWIRRVDGKLRVAHQPVEQPYTLNVLDVTQPDDLNEINPVAEHDYWMVRLHPNAGLPAGWQSGFPTVRRVVPVGHVQDLRNRVHAIQLGDDPLEGLDEWLITAGLTRKQTDWAVQYARRSA